MAEQELRNSMKKLVNTWWSDLTNDQKTAVKLLKFSRPIIGSMFFFNSDTANGFAIEDYKDMRRMIEEYGIDHKDFSCGIDWEDYHKNEQECRRIERNISNNGLISKLPASLKNQVVDNLRRQDDYWNVCWDDNIKYLKEARKTMFWNAIAELRKEVEG